MPAPSVRTIPLSFFLITAVIVTLRLAALAFDGGRVWGFDFYRYLDGFWIAVCTALPLLAALPRTGVLLEQWLSQPRVQGVAPWAAVLLLAAGIVFLPMSTFYYGDGGPLISEVYKIGAQEHYTSRMLLNLQSAPLAGALLHGLTLVVPTVMDTVGMRLPESPLFPFMALGLLAAVCLGVVLHLEKDGKLRLPLLLLLLGGGGVLLFFRYAEMYLPVFVAVTAYLLAASASLRGKLPLWPVLLLFAVAVAAHYMVLALLPSVVFLLARDNETVRRFTGSPRRLLLVFGGMLALAFAVYFLLGYQRSDSRVIMPLLPVESAAGTLSYTLLSSYHLVDLLNLVLLLGTFPLLMLLAGAWKRGAKHTASQRVDEWSLPLRFQLVAAWSFLLFLFFANTSLGLARDWDIAAPLGAMLVFVFVEAWRGGTSNAGNTKTGDAEAGAFLQAGLVAVMLVMPWVAVNVDDEASTTRFAGIMALDDNHMYGDYALSGYEALRKHVVHVEDYGREGEILQRMIEVVGYTEQYRMLIVNALYFADRDSRRYLALNTWMLDRLGSKTAELRAQGKERDYAIGLKQIDSLVAVMATESITYGRHRDLRPEVERFSSVGGLSTGMRIFEGAELYAAQRYPEGIPVFESIRQAGFRDPRVDGMYASCLYVGGDRGRGEREFEDGLRLHGDNPQYLFMMATSYLQRDGRFAEARALLERALALDPPEDARAQISGLLQQLQAYLRSMETE